MKDEGGKSGVRLNNRWPIVVRGRWSSRGAGRHKWILKAHEPKEGAVDEGIRESCHTFDSMHEGKQKGRISMF
jgi:hypothetical protein